MTIPDGWTVRMNAITAWQFRLPILNVTNIGGQMHSFESFSRIPLIPSQLVRVVFFFFFFSFHSPYCLLVGGVWGPGSAKNRDGPRGRGTIRRALGGCEHN